MAKRYFAEQKLPFKEIDVLRDSRGLRDMAALTGQRAVPVIRVGEQAMVGWDETRFERLRSARPE